MNRRSFVRHSLAASAAFGLVRGPSPVWSQTPAVSIPDSAGPTGKITFGAVRGGSDIGRYSAEIARAGDVVTVTSETSIAVTVLMFTAYKFEQRTREVWRGGRLVEFSATTDDDGTKNQVEGKANGNALLLNVDGKTETMPQTIVPASLWNPRLVQQSKLLDTADGRQLNIAVKMVGEETLNIRGTAVKARRFAFTGDMERDILYDQNWMPVQAIFLASKDKSEIKLTLA